MKGQEKYCHEIRDRIFLKLIFSGRSFFLPGGHGGAVTIKISHHDSKVVQCLTRVLDLGPPALLCPGKPVAASHDIAQVLQPRLWRVLCCEQAPTTGASGIANGGHGQLLKPLAAVGQGSLRVPPARLFFYQPRGGSRGPPAPPPGLGAHPPTTPGSSF